MGLKKISSLESHLTNAIQNSSSLNPLNDLLPYTTHSDPRIAHKAIYALYRVFSLALASPLYQITRKTGSQELQEVKNWLEGRLDEFVDTLGGLLSHEMADLRTAALDILMSLLRHRSSSISKTGDPRIHLGHLKKTAQALLSLPTDDITSSHVHDLFASKWFNEYWDIRWLFLREVEVTLKSTEAEVSPTINSKALSLLERMKDLPETSSSSSSSTPTPTPKKTSVPKVWITELASPPSSTDTDTDADADPTPSSKEKADDWRTFFDTPTAMPTSESTPTTTTTAQGKVQRIYKLSLAKSVLSSSAHNTQMSNTWLALVPALMRSERLSARALTVVHGVVSGVGSGSNGSTGSGAGAGTGTGEKEGAGAKRFRQPIKLMDWIAGCVDYGGSVGLLALNVLFRLITAHNLDYPDFYTRLYSFLDRDCLHMKYRSRFFRLLEKFLSSPHLPTNLLASFVKRLSRLSLTAPPSALVVIIPFTYNILKRHLPLMSMIHNEDVVDSMEVDPYNPLSPSPFDTQAHDSSLWEITSLTNHYHPSVGSLAKIFREAFTKQGFRMEDFLDQSYGTLFRGEFRKTIKYDPAMQDALPEVSPAYDIWDLS